ncbi:DUF6883 domain-containing protein [Leptolyngbya sp. 7M]|uniref:DUF6883 domain-containing protein n=1 Tax=Leptolyngbya sp. 7M TaxID=2812896 RepID=UPI001B8B3952|nr:DUF6883 domain-containing protein [Leptolyngbya sp. 7M]QYO64210.1 hypothetical protein JVX88_31475 [Leptolyngbya sp. 7M]
MQLPNHERAVIESSKLIHYLLNPNHKRGGTKAKLLIQSGYSQANWQQLEQDIRTAHLSKEVDTLRETDYGTRYEISAPILTPTGRFLAVRTVWQIDQGADVPRLITLIPD